mmetsp:Transcript_99985/g.258476  ORF Transcript_99985/g.258476 Transcript_99985/m.258476 type:complete len:368 (-) Transcript_99985:61-1164(-)
MSSGAMAAEVEEAEAEAPPCAVSWGWPGSPAIAKKSAAASATMSSARSKPTAGSASPFKCWMPSTTANGRGLQPEDPMRWRRTTNAPSLSSRLPRTRCIRKPSTCFLKVSERTSKHLSTSAWLCTASVPALPCKCCRGPLLTVQANIVEVNVCKAFSSSKISGSASMHACKSKQRPRMRRTGGIPGVADDWRERRFTKSSKRASAFVRKRSFGITRQRWPNVSMAPTRTCMSFELCHELIRIAKAVLRACETRRFSSDSSVEARDELRPPPPTNLLVVLCAFAPPPEAAFFRRSSRAAMPKTWENVDSVLRMGSPGSLLAQFTRATQREHHALKSKSLTSGALHDWSRGKYLPMTSWMRPSKAWGVV